MPTELLFSSARSSGGWGRTVSSTEPSSIVRGASVGKSACIPIRTAALQLLCDSGFEVAGLQVIRWRAVVGNWASRRVAAKVGFVFDGTVRSLLVHRGELLDGWIATLLRDDPRLPQPWLHPIQMEGKGVRLRPFRTSDVDRIVEACSDPRTTHWLVSMPRPYERHNALAYLDSIAELAARGLGVAWCMADPRDDRCLGSISLDGLAALDRPCTGGCGDRLLDASRCARSGGRDRCCPARDQTRKEVWAGEVDPDSLRAWEPGVATCGGACWLLQDRNTADLGAAE